MIMKQTVEEAAWQELMSSYAIVVKGEFAYQQQAMLNMFRKGVEWQAKQSPWISVEDAIPNKQAKGMCQVKFVDGSIDEKVRFCGSYANYEPLFSHLITWFSW